MIDKITVLDSDRIVPSSKNVISNFKSIIWNTEYYGTGDFKIDLPATKDNLLVFNDENSAYVSRSDDENIGVIETIKIKRSCPEPSIEVSGRFIKSILDRRIVGNASVLVKDIASGKATYNLAILRAGQFVETSIRQLVGTTIVYREGENANPRTVRFIKLGDSSGIQLKIDSQIQSTGEDLLYFTDRILAEYGLGAKMIMDAERYFCYVVYQGADHRKNNADGNKAIIFSPKISNFVNTEKNRSTLNYKNVAIIGGQGEGYNRFYALINWDKNPETDPAHAGINRREYFIDARDQSKTYADSSGYEAEYTDKQYHDMLVQRANNALFESRIEESYSGEAVPSASSYVYKKDYNVGDLVSVIDEDGELFDARVLSVTESQDKDNGYSAFPTLG